MLRTHGLWTAIGLVALAAASAEEPKGAVTPEAIAGWIRDLDDDSFGVRQNASRQLANAGREALPFVAEAARSDRLEVVERSLQILDQATFSPDPVLARTALDSLAALAKLSHPSAARAQRILRGRTERVAAALERLGAGLEFSDHRVLAVNFDSAKGYVRHLRLLHELPDLERLSFSSEEFDNAAAAALTGLAKVREINLFQSRIGDDGLAVLKTLPGLRRVPMGMTQVTDAGLVHLKDLTQLEYIGLRGNNITDAGLVHLKDLTNLTGLYLGETKVTDAGLVNLSKLTKLNMLRLDNTAVTDAGLERLKELTALTSLDLSKTKVTTEGVKRLQEALPTVRILHLPE